MRLHKASSLGLTSVFLASLALGGEAIPNWSAPATWSPAKSRNGLTAMDLTNPLPFIGLAPCRIVDTRGNGAPIQGGIFTGGSDVRSYAVSGICGIPASARALSLNFTVTGPGQTGAGFLLAWPTGGAAPSVSILNWDHAPEQIANAAVVPTNTSTSFMVNVSSPTHVIIDVNGYYPQLISGGALAPNENFSIEGSAPFGVIQAYNDYIGGGGGFGIVGRAQNTTSSSAGVLGVETATSGRVFGVLGEVSSTTSAAAGVSGLSLAITGNSYGVYGSSASGSANASAVFGAERGTGTPIGSYIPAGVRGESFVANGVLGISRSSGVAGSVVNTANSELAYGILGYNNGTVYGVFAGGNFGGSGAKYFIEPHPTDASKVIRYVSLEGPEAGTYFRGRGKFQSGLATIDVPEDFRMVTDPDGLSIQVTPIGELATVAVLRIDLEGVLVKSSRNVEFFYTVNGVRRTHRDLKPIGDGSEFMPRSAEARMPAYLTEGQKALLVSNGTYNADGSVNMETAERLGWAKAWREREQ